MLTSALSVIARPPCVFGGLSMIWGYVRGASERVPRYQHPAFRSFLRRDQRAALLHGKRMATRALDDTWWEGGQDERAFPPREPSRDGGRWS